MTRTAAWFRAGAVLQTGCLHFGAIVFTSFEDWIEGSRCCSMDLCKEQGPCRLLSSIMIANALCASTHYLLAAPWQNDYSCLVKQHPSYGVGPLQLTRVAVAKIIGSRRNDATLIWCARLDLFLVGYQR